MSRPSSPLRIGTRGSPLALAQSELVREALHRAGALEHWPSIELSVIKTTGDHILDRPLAEVGGKGLFTKEIEQALIERHVDLAVHSMKDVETVLPDGLIIAAMLPRGDPRDVLITKVPTGIADLPAGARIGSSSLRRAAILRSLRSDIEVVALRGSVQTRLRRLEEGAINATLLAAAGLARLGLDLPQARAIEPEVMLPAVGQAAIGIEARAGDTALLELLERIGDRRTLEEVTAERRVLAHLDGSCRTPIAALAEMDGERGRLRALVLKPDGSERHEADEETTPGTLIDAADEIGQRLRAHIGPDFFAV